MGNEFEFIIKLLLDYLKAHPEVVEQLLDALVKWIISQIPPQ